MLEGVIISDVSHPKCWCTLLPSCSVMLTPPPPSLIWYIPQNYNVCKRLCFLQAQYVGKGIHFEKNLLAHIMLRCKLFTDKTITSLCEETEVLYAR